MNNPTPKQLHVLWSLCQTFIFEQDIHSSETVYQCDNVILNANEFIENICNIVGYKEIKED